MSHGAFKGKVQTQVIAIEPLAPAKPRWGEPCNGCGLCCLVAPCPLGMLLSRRRQGECAALRWDGAAALYRCGALAAPEQATRDALPRAPRFVAVALTGVLKRAAGRWIAAGQGCDSTLEVRRPEDIADNGVSPVRTP